MDKKVMDKKVESGKWSVKIFLLFLLFCFMEYLHIDLL